MGGYLQKAFCGLGIATLNKSIITPEKSTPKVGCENKKVFSEDDTQVIGIDLGMERESVERVLGNPLKTIKYIEGATGDTLIDYYYGFGEIGF